MRMKTEKQPKTTDGAARGRVVLVGTYKGDQLKCCQCESVASSQFQFPMMAKLKTGNIGIGNIGNNGTLSKSLSSVTELWLYRAPDRPPSRNLSARIG